MEMEQPTNVNNIRRFLGMTNHVGRFSPNLATITKPLRDLLVQTKSLDMGTESSSRAWRREERPQSYTCSSSVWPQSRNNTVCRRVISFGLGAVLLQRHEAAMRPVAYASRAMTATEQRYSQIEKEALATIWSLERLSDYLYGIKFHVEADISRWCLS